MGCTFRDRHVREYVGVGSSLIRYNRACVTSLGWEFVLQLYKLHGQVNRWIGYPAGRERGTVCVCVVHLVEAKFAHNLPPLLQIYQNHLMQVDVEKRGCDGTVNG